MVGAVSLNPYVSGYQYTGSHVRTRAMAQDTQVQAVQNTGAAAGTQAVSAGRRGGAASMIGARSIAAAGQASGVAAVSAGRGADPESPIEPVDAVSSVKAGNRGSTNYSIPFLRKGMDPAELAVRMRMQYSSPGQSGAEGVHIDLPGGSSKAAAAGMPGSSQSAAEAVQFDLPGGSSKAAAAGVTGSSQGAAEAVQLDLPGGSSKAAAAGVTGSSQGAAEAVQLDLPGTPGGAEEQMGLPGTSTGAAAEAGLPGVSSGAESSAADEGKSSPEIAGLSTGDTQKATEDTECRTCAERKYQDGSDDPGVSFKTPTHIGPDQSASSVLGHEMEHVVRERAKAQSEGRRVISQSVTMQTGICPECGRVYTAGGTTRTVTAAETKPQEQPKDPRWILAASA